MIVLTGCETLKMIDAMSKVLPMVKPGATIPEDKVVLIGMVTFIPEPEQKGQMQVLSITGDSDLRRRSDIAFLKDGTKSIDFYEMNLDHVGQVRWGEYFAFVFPRRNVYLKGVSVDTLEEAMRTEILAIPCSLCIEVSEGEQAIYIGDFEFHLGETNSMGGTTDFVHIRDSFDSASQVYDLAFLDSAGGKLPLRKHLATGESTVVTSKNTFVTRHRY
jgi:hypothetical protein